jgi:hypothetical protein
MEYDSKDNIWRAAGSLPETLRTISCWVSWCDSIFVSGCVMGENHHMVFYMFEPLPISNATVAEGETFGKWVVIAGPKLSQPTFTQPIVSFVYASMVIVEI